MVGKKQACACHVDEGNITLKFYLCDSLYVIASPVRYRSCPPYVGMTTNSHHYSFKNPYSYTFGFILSAKIASLLLNSAISLV